MTKAGAKVSKAEAARRAGPEAGTAVTLKLYFKFADSGIVRVAEEFEMPATTTPENVPFAVYTLVTVVAAEANRALMLQPRL